LDFIDSHAHIYPDPIAEKAAKSIGTFYEMPIEGDGRLSTLLERGREAGIVKHLVHSVGVTPDRVPRINDYLIQTAAKYPDRLVGFGTLHPDMADVRAELRRIRAAGLRGVKLHPDFQHFLLDSDAAVAMFRALAEMGLPALVHTGDKRYPYSEPGRMARVLAAVPELTVICAHLGGWSLWSEAWKQLADLPNVWVDTSSSLYALQPEEAAGIIRRYDGGHVLFGTDFPMWDPVEERARFDALPLTEVERENIAHRNFERFMKGLEERA
jgi:uncharacterized protein